MIKFTKEEISLCKQVAEKERKPFKWGDWYYFKEKVHLIWSKPEPIMDDSCIPLWTISDCLDFLKEKGCNNYLHLLHNKTPLVSCLKAVLAVVEEER